MSDSVYKPGNYKVSKEGNIVKQDKACDLDPIRKKDNIEVDDDNKNPDQAESDTTVKNDGAI